MQNIPDQKQHAREHPSKGRRSATLSFENPQLFLSLRKFLIGMAPIQSDVSSDNSITSDWQLPRIEPGYLVRLEHRVIQKSVLQRSGKIEERLKKRLEKRLEKGATPRSKPCEGDKLKLTLGEATN